MVGWHHVEGPYGIINGKLVEPPPHVGIRFTGENYYRVVWEDRVDSTLKFDSSDQATQWIMNGQLNWVYRPRDTANAGGPVFPDKADLIQTRTIEDPNRLWNNEKKNVNPDPPAPPWSCQ